MIEEEDRDGVSNPAGIGSEPSGDDDAACERHRQEEKTHEPKLRGHQGAGSDRARDPERISADEGFVVDEPRNEDEMEKDVYEGEHVVEMVDREFHLGGSQRNVRARSGKDGAGRHDRTPADDSPAEAVEILSEDVNRLRHHGVIRNPFNDTGRVRYPALTISTTTSSAPFSHDSSRSTGS
jgi:hypothetical protein